jgi:CRP/FNR family transcriptional regulator
MNTQVPGHADGLDVAVLDAWQRSFMADFPPDVTSALLADIRMERLEPGDVFYRGAHHGATATLALVVDGLVRILLMQSTGRQVTIRYAPPGSVVGLPSNLLISAGRRSARAPDKWLEMGGAAIDAQAVRSTTLLHLRPDRFESVTRQNPKASWALSLHLASQVVEAQQQLAAELFLPVRARVAGHLLSLAEPSGQDLVVRVRHDAIAAAMGSVREVVSRELKRMEHEGLVQRIGGPAGYLRIIDAAALREASRGADGGNAQR